MLEIFAIVKHEYATQDVTCYDCMRHYCRNCVAEDEVGTYCMSDVCGICNRRYCFNCSREWNCLGCDRFFCVECMDMKECDKCYQNTCLKCISNRKCRNNCCEGKIWCEVCVEYDGALIRCGNCGTNVGTDYCYLCCDSNSDDVIHSIDHCGECGENLCGVCRVIKCKEEMRNSCTGCYRFAFPALLEDKERQIQEMQTEIDKQRNEIDQLKREVEDLTGELVELKDMKAEQNSE
eukprot:scaffold9896_cov119-Skeletonema_menzelii.AAC.4